MPSRVTSYFWCDDVLSVCDDSSEEVEVFEEISIPWWTGVWVIFISLTGDVGFAMCLRRDDSVDYLLFSLGRSLVLSFWFSKLS